MEEILLGLLCSIASILILVLFVAYQETQYCSIFGISIGRLYTNVRADLRLALPNA